MSVNIIKKDGKKYIEGEEVLCKYECTDRGTILVRLLLFSLMLFFYFYQVEKDELLSFKLILSTIVWLLIPLWLIFRDIKNFYHKGFYLTKKHFITFSGKKIPLINLYFKRGAGAMGWGRVALSFYNNKNFILHCIEEDNTQFNNLLLDFYEVSKNKQFKINPIIKENNFYQIQQSLKHKLI